VSPVVPVPPVVPPEVPEVPDVLLGAVADVSPLPPAVSFFLQAPSMPREAIKAAVTRILGAMVNAFIVYTPRFTSILCRCTQVRRLGDNGASSADSRALRFDEAAQGTDAIRGPVKRTDSTVRIRLAMLLPVRQTAHTYLASARQASGI
jgi:hypothetical protein